MNKVIVIENENLVNGSTVLAPKREPYPGKEEEYEKLRKIKEKQKALIEKRTHKKAQVIKGIGLAFLIGIIMIGRYSAVYNLQGNLAEINSDIHNYKMENENLKVQLIKASDIQEVEKSAKTKLHMVTPDKDNIMYVNTTKDYFADQTKEKGKNTKEDLIAKIKNMLF